MVAACYVLGYVLSALVGFAITTNHFPELLDTKRNATSMERALLKFGAPLIIAALINQAQGRIEAGIVASMIGFRQSGMYSAALTLSQILLLTLLPFAYGLLPTFSSLLGQDLALMKKTYLTVIRWSLLSTLPVWLLLEVAARSLIKLFFGDGFTNALEPFRVLSFGFVLYCFFHASGQLLAATGATLQYTLAAGAAVVVDVFSTIWLVQPFGPLGAAIGTTMGFLVLGLLQMYLTWRLVHVHPFSMGVIKLFVIALGIAFVMLYAENLLGEQGIGGFIWGFISVTIFAILALLTKSFAMDDYVILRGITRMAFSKLVLGLKNFQSS